MANESFPVPQEAVEAGLLNAVGESTARWLEIAHISTDDFTAHREVYLFMRQYLQQYGKLPSHNQISTRFEWHPPIGDFQYWLVEMRRYVLARHVLEVMQAGHAVISQPEQALGLMLERLSLIRSEQSNHIQATDANAGERYQKYLARQEHIYRSNNILGLPTGMRIFDDTRVGWIPGSLVGTYARPSVGKTWWLMWEGMHTWFNGGSVLAITPEMPANMLSLRIDVLAGAALEIPIEYNKLLIGHPEVQDDYLRITQIMEQSQRWWTYDSLEDQAIGLGQLIGLIRQHDPDIVLIDGVSLLRSDSRGSTWEQMRDMMYGLKNIATIHEKPILVTHQAVNSARGRRTEIEAVGRGDDFIMPSLNDAAYGDSFVAACSDVITMVADPESDYVRWYSIRKARERSFPVLPARMAFAWQPGFGRIIDLSHLGHNREAVGQETRRLLGVL